MHAGGKTFVVEIAFINQTITLQMFRNFPSSQSMKISAIKGGKRKDIVDIDIVG